VKTLTLKNNSVVVNRHFISGSNYTFKHMKTLNPVFSGKIMYEYSYVFPLRDMKTRKIDSYEGMLYPKSISSAIKEDFNEYIDTELDYKLDSFEEELSFVEVSESKFLLPLNPRCFKIFKVQVVYTFNCKGEKYA